MTQQIKKYAITSLMVSIFVLFPWYMGIQALMGIVIEPINLNKPLLWAQAISLALMVYIIAKAIIAVHQYTPDEVDEYAEAERQTEAEIGEMYMSNHRTGEITWGNLNDEKIESIKLELSKDRYTVSWYDLEEIKRQYKDINQIVLHINNLQRPWIRKKYNKNKNLTEVGYFSPMEVA